MGITQPSPPTLAEIEQQREDLLNQADLPSEHATSPADPDLASPPITALPTPEPLPLSAPPQPALQHQALSTIARGLRHAAEWAQAQPEILFRRDPAASELWNDYYATLSQARSGLRAAENGLTRKQIRDLFHGNISSSSIDQALEKLRSLGTATCRVTGAGQGRPATLWWAIGDEYREPMKEKTPEESLRRQLSALVRTF